MKFEALFGNSRIFMKMTTIPLIEGIYREKIQFKNMMASKI